MALITMNFELKRCATTGSIRAVLLLSLLQTSFVSCANAAVNTAPAIASEKDEWKLHMKDCAQYEWKRLNNLRFNAAKEDEMFKQDRIELRLADGISFVLVKIKAGEYTEGLSKEQVDLLTSLPNRRSDSYIWRDMYPEGVRRTVVVPYDFFIMETLVTNKVFRAFTVETGYRTTVSRYRTGWLVTEKAEWKQGIANEWSEPPLGVAYPDHPVVEVSWFDSMFLAQWLSAKFGVVFRPPTKDEWLLAAYPHSMAGQTASFTWGNDIEEAAKRANLGSSELSSYDWIHDQFADGFPYTSPVKAFTPNEQGIYDMGGNVWSWNFQKQIFENGKRQADEGEGQGDRRIAAVPELMSLGAQDNSHITMQGGCYLARITHISMFAKMSHPALDGAEDIGIRLVAMRAANSGLPKVARD